LLPTPGNLFKKRHFYLASLSHDCCFSLAKKLTVENAVELFVAGHSSGADLLMQVCILGGFFLGGDTCALFKFDPRG
jgi:hypothetical protein